MCSDAFHRTTRCRTTAPLTPRRSSRWSLRLILDHLAAITAPSLCSANIQMSSFTLLLSFWLSLDLRFNCIIFIRHSCPTISPSHHGFASPACLRGLDEVELYSNRSSPPRTGVRRSAGVIGLGCQDCIRPSLKGAGCEAYTLKGVNGLATY